MLNRKMLGWALAGLFGFALPLTAYRLPFEPPQGGALQVVPAVHADTASATATTVTLTYAAVAGKAHVLSMLSWAYIHAPSSGTIAVYDGDGSSSTQIVFREAVTADGPGFPQQWNPAKVGTPGLPMTIKLVNTDATDTGYINATHYLQ